MKLKDMRLFYVLLCHKNFQKNLQRQNSASNDLFLILSQR